MREGERKDFGVMPGCEAGGCVAGAITALSWGQDWGGGMHAGARHR